METTDTKRAEWWRAMMVFGPLVAFVAPLFVVWLLGGWDDTQLINKPVTFLESIGILGPLCFPCGAFLWARRKRNIELARSSRTWPTIPGEVQTSEVERRITGLPMVLWKLALSYSYKVAERSYQGNAVQFGAKFVTSKELILAQAKKYPPGAAVTLHYDPDDPETSVLETSDEMSRQNVWQIWAYFLTPFVISIVVAIKHAVR